MEYGEGETPLEPGNDGIIKINRAPEEVFRPQTMASFEGKPVTISHPNEFVNAQNWSQLAKGVVQNVRKGTGEFADSLIADLLITDTVAIALVKNGLREVSCGYEAEYTQTGEGEGIQTNIIGNHVALVDEGRAGSEYAIEDHKGVTMDKKTMFAKLCAAIGLTKDEAKKFVQDAEPPPEEPAKDAMGSGYDALVKAIKDLNAVVSNMTGPTKAAPDAAAPPAGTEPTTPAADDENSMEGRMKKLEASVAAILEKMSTKAGDAEEDEPVVMDDDMEEESIDEDMDEDDAEDAANCTGHTASRVEILAPGLEAKGKDIKAKALKACYDTKEGKKIHRNVEWRQSSSI